MENYTHLWIVIGDEDVPGFRQYIAALGFDDSFFNEIGKPRWKKPMTYMEVEFDGNPDNGREKVRLIKEFVVRCHYYEYVLSDEHGVHVWYSDPSTVHVVEPTAEVDVEWGEIYD